MSGLPTLAAAFIFSILIVEEVQALLESIAEYVGAALFLTRILSGET